MKNPGQAVTGFETGSTLNGCEPYSQTIREHLKAVPSVRPEKVTRTQRLMASGNWPPRVDTLVDRLLFEHLLGPR